ncbi:glycosyltransferase [Avibacterium avium]|uniref:glycosyltransferase n=1 Tax=Avibacterium avium TaxID=751 RepID=UPI003BF9208C
MAAYNLHSKIKLLYWAHTSGIVNVWKNNPQFFSVVLNKYTHFVAISDEMQTLITKTLEKSLGIHRKSLLSLYNPFNIQEIQQNALLARAEDEALLNQPFILQVARLENRSKNHLEMIEIYHKLKQKGIPEKLYFIGDGEDETLLRNKIHSLNLQNDCLILGRRDNPYPFMKAAKLFLHTAKFEGLGMVLIESMACGTPVVAMDCPTGPKEILGNGKYGALVPLHDQETFVARTYELLTNEQVYQHYTSLLPEAIAPFSNEVVSKQFLEFLDSLD